MSEARNRSALPFGTDAVVASWFGLRTYSAEEFPTHDLVSRKKQRVSIVIPARNVQATIGSIVAGLRPLSDATLIDEIIVVDGSSDDDTCSIARAEGANVYDQSELVPEFGPVEGKGDALWRSLAVATGDIIVFLDADTEDFGPHYALGLIGPLLTDKSVSLVKGAYRRPFRLGDELAPEGGGRVTELLARPWLNLHLPELAGFIQPLAGETAARRSLLERLSFPVGYGVEIGILIDALRELGLDALAQVDLGTRQNRHQSLRDLSVMAYAVLVAAESRIGRTGEARPGVLETSPEGMRTRGVAIGERPPYSTLAKPAV